jgi:GntR family transcriptional regulator/MocR family aminotransferase
VVYVGSFSKTFSPSVRLGFAVVPGSLTEPILAVRQLIDWHPPIAMQTALAGFIEDGLLDKHIRRSRRVYADRHHILTAALSGPLGGQLTARSSNAGLHVAAMLGEGRQEKEVLQVAARHGIAVSGLHDCFHTAPAQPGLVIGFGAVSTTELPTALRMLDRALSSPSRR